MSNLKRFRLVPVPSPEEVARQEAAGGFTPAWLWAIGITRSNSVGFRERLAARWDMGQRWRIFEGVGSDTAHAVNSRDLEDAQNMLSSAGRATRAGQDTNLCRWLMGCALEQARAYRPQAPDDDIWRDSVTWLEELSTWAFDREHMARGWRPRYAVAAAVVDDVHGLLDQHIPARRPDRDDPRGQEEVAT